MNQIALTIVSLALIWAAWDLIHPWTRAKWPSVMEPHCCECEQLQLKCDAMKSGVYFYDGAPAGKL